MRHDNIAVLGEIRHHQTVPAQHGPEPVLAGRGVGFAAGARVGDGEDVAVADEDAVVGFAVAAGEVVEVEFGEGSGHGLWVEIWRWSLRFCGCWGNAVGGGVRLYRE